MTSIVHIAIPCPLRQGFDYLSDLPSTAWSKGIRVKVPFGSRQVIGIVLNSHDNLDKQPISKLKVIIEKLDEQPLITVELFNLIQWVSHYYHHPIGECFQAALPKKLRQGESAELLTETIWKITSLKKEDNLGIKQQKIIDLLVQNASGLNQQQITQQLGQSRSSLISLENKQKVVQQQQIKLPSTTQILSTACQLNDEQQCAVDTVWSQRSSFSAHLLQGITGSGKTEVYIHLTQQMLADNKQVLILIPEIGLTTQFVERFRQRLAARIVVLNSSISAGERKQSWLLAKEGLADVVIGTRSAVFTSLKKVGLIIIDEEHDSSYKQQDGLRYHARNIALVRAKRLSIPIVLGSATPSLESLYHVQQGRYKLLTLNKRATGASLPKVKMVDTAGPTANSGITSELYQAIQTQIAAGNQVLLFINRRGFAPVLMCHECNWQATCSHCDARMIVHHRRHILMCHHCGFIQRLPQQCPQCKTTDLNTYGAGTEQIEQTLQGYFPDTPVLRIDRDSTQRVNAFADVVKYIQQGGAKILVGTQMLAKGHDFHNVTLVGVIDADQGLFSADFRATEVLAQLITQVTGRAGRGKKAGKVLIQTSQPQHQLWQDLIGKGYSYTAKKLLQQRQEISLPPAGSLCMIRAEDKQQQLAIQFLTEVLAIFNQHNQQQVMVMGPVPAIMEKRAGRYRAQLLLSSPQRKPIHQLLDQYIDVISRLKLARKVRWSIDIDPLDLM
ncbi:MAG: primosomal protein N' [Methylophaga sp.]|nr:MAG: primosomal protein N' [Methylophaga sp.]